MTVEMRASDADRERTVAALQRHTEAGRLSLDEFTERVDAACAARTLTELARVTHDLPVEPEPAAVPVPVGGTRNELLLVFLVAAVTLLLLGAFLVTLRD